MSHGPPPAPSETSHRGHRILGRYELIGELARGGMGTVYLARNAGEGRFQRLFAIKVLHPHLAAETAFIDMMRDEAQIAARLHHPNVVPILDLGMEGDVHYVVMDYVEGPALSTIFRRSPDHRRPDALVAIVIDTLEGLHAAHTLQDDHGEEIRLVHRDVSPPNILVGSDGIARITDFGIAKAEARMTSTRPGTRKGKLQFMSPEQIRDGETIDHRTDIWAIGVVLWNALTGRNLFKGESDGATIHNILEKVIPPPSTEGLKPPSCFDTIVLRALSRDPANRYATALEMADALRVTAAGNGLAATKQDVAGWVVEMLGAELEQRRKAVREISQRRLDSQNPADSQVNVLRAPPSLRPLTTSGAITLTQLSHIPSFNVEQSNPGSTPLPEPAAEIVVDTDVPETPEFHPRRTGVWVGLALAGVALIAILFLMIRSSDETSREGQAGHAASAGHTATVAEPTESAEPEPASARPSAEAEQAARARAAEEEKKVHSAPKRGPVQGAPAPEPARETKSEAKEQTAPTPRPAPVPAAPTPRPAPVPAPADDFERNPYLRR
jgi:eukaryotic-like serine/threonine-protein kinase